MRGRIFSGASLAIALLLPAAAFAAKSDVADAAERGDMTALRSLISQKADVNAAQGDGATALHWAVYRQDHAMVDALLKAGANPKVANREGSTPMWLASVDGTVAVMAGGTWCDDGR